MGPSSFRCSLLLCLIPLTTVVAQNERQIAPIAGLRYKIAPTRIFDRSPKDAPLVIRSEREARSHFNDYAMERLLVDVDFRRQYVVVFSWRGSGEDKLEYKALDGRTKEVVFDYRPGATRNLIPHLHIYTVRNDFRWRTENAKDEPTEPTEPKPESYILVEVLGELNSRVAAIGGETTGVTITANGVTWELELGRNPRLRRAAEQLHGSMVVVRGELHVRRGVEIKQRAIVVVESLAEPRRRRR